MTASSSLTSFELAALVANLAEDRKAKDTLLLHTEYVSSLADYFVIATVESRTQMKALADYLVKALKQQNLSPLGQQIDPTGHWSLLDFGDVVIHLFNHEDRSLYNLERFWNHANEIPHSQWAQSVRQAS